MRIFAFNGSNWHEFFDQYWNKQPVVIKNISKAYNLKTEELFNSLAETCDAFRSDDSTQIKLYVNNNQVIQDLYDSLPSTKLGNFENYAQLIKDKYHSETFTLYVNGLLAQHPSIWLKYYRFLQEVFANQEISLQTIDFEVFAGRYKSTAGGVHQEACANFHFIVHGKKTMRVWHPDIFRSHAFKTYQTASERYLICSDYQEYLNESIPLEGEAGDILYWPAGYWHVGESPQVSASVNLAMYMQENAIDFVMHNLKKYLTHSTDTASNEIAEALSLLQQTMNAKSFHNVMLQHKLEKISSFGLEKIVKRQITKLNDNTVFSTSSQSPLEIAEVDENTLLYGAFGHIFKTEKNNNLLRLLNLLNTTEKSSLSEVKNKFHLENDDILMIEKIITDLYSIHWLSMT